MSLPASRTESAPTPRWRRVLPLYLQIWLAVVLAVAVLTISFWALWRANLDEVPPRQVIIRNAAGEVIGQTLTRAVRLPGFGIEFQVPTRDGTTLHVQLPLRPPREGRPPGPPDAVGLRPGGPGGPGVREGARPLLRGPFTLAWVLGIVAVAVALGLYPIVRHLTRRLEALANSAERWGAGDLAARAPVTGEDEIGRLAERFNAAAERVQTLVASHKSLLANASHELRSPLARIRMAVELMQQIPSDALRAEISRNVTELDQLIDEILLASRLDARADLGEVETVDLLALVAEECARVQVSFEADPADAVAAPPDPTIRPATSTSGHSTPGATWHVSGSSRLLRRLVRNLLENALRYGAPAGAQDVEAVLGHGPAGALELTVSDRGAGVPLAERERIFEPFYRSAGASESSGGVGLGLSLVRSIAHRHGGNATCEDRPGGGARFVVSLPNRGVAH